METEEKDINIVHTYIKELNEELKGISKTDVLDLFTKLCGLEGMFVKRLRMTAEGKRVYMVFIDKVNHTKGGIKIAKPYFRERQEFFSETVNKAIRDKKPELMYDVPVNYKFV